MSILPAQVDVPTEALLKFKSAFGAYVRSERQRLNRDKQILKSMQTSDLQAMVASSVDNLAAAAEVELQQMIDLAAQL